MIDFDLPLRFDDLWSLSQIHSFDSNDFGSYHPQGDELFAALTETAVGPSIFRDLTLEELSVSSSSSDPIVVTHYRLSSTFDQANILRWAADTYDDPGSSSQPTPPCWWGMGNEERVDTLTDEVADGVLSAILAQSDQRMEYGSVIYVALDGSIVASPLRASSNFTTQLDYSAVPLGSDGLTDFSRILAIVHSHPQYLPNEDGSPGYTNYFDIGDPFYLLSPSIRTDMSDDWFVYDDMRARIAGDGGNPDQFTLYIAGFNGTTLVLNQFNGADRGSEDGAGGDGVARGYVSPLNTDC